MKYISFTYIYV